MSRIFDALQRSKSEGDGFEFPLMSSLAAEVPTANRSRDRRFCHERYRSVPVVGNFCIAE